MSCGYSEEVLALFVEGDLPPAQSAQIENHLHECARCGELVAGLRESQSILKFLRQDSVDSDDVVSSVHQRVMDEIGAKGQSPWVLRIERVLLGFRWRYALAGFAILAIVSGLVWHSGPSGPPPETIVSKVVVPLPPYTPVPVATPAPNLAPKKTAPVRVSKAIRQKPVPQPARVQPAVDEPNQLVVKLITDNPNIVIYWLVDQKGAGE